MCYAFNISKIMHSSVFIKISQANNNKVFKYLKVLTTHINIIIHQIKPPSPQHNPTDNIKIRILLSTLQKLLALYSHGENTPALVNWRMCKKLR